MALNKANVKQETRGLVSIKQIDYDTLYQTASFYELLSSTTFKVLCVIVPVLVADSILVMYQLTSNIISLYQLNSNIGTHAGSLR